MKYEDMNGLSYDAVGGVAHIEQQRPSGIWVGFDLDGVLADSYRGLARILAEAGYPVEWEYPPTYEVSGWGLCDAAHDAIVERLGSDCQLYGEIEPMEGAHEALDYFRWRGYQVAVITSRNPVLKIVTIGWLTYHQLVPDKLVMTQDKARVAQELKLELMFEDHPLHLEHLQAVGIRIFRPDYAYNAGAPGEPYGSLADVIETLDAEELSDVANVC